MYAIRSYYEWARIEDEFAYIGISDFAQDQLGDIVFVDMPEVGDSLDQGDEFGSLESVKAVSEMYMPLSGEVVEINEDLSESPELLNADPYENWIIKIRMEDLEDYDQLLDAEAYLESLEE